MYGILTFTIKKSTIHVGKYTSPMDNMSTENTNLSSILDPSRSADVNLIILPS